MLDGAPLPSTAELGKALGEDGDALAAVIGPMDLAATHLVDGVVTSDEDGVPGFALRAHREEARRFHFCRGLSEVLVAPGADALLTRAGSDRQALGRAFAAEFLAPSEGLRSKAPQRPVLDEDDVGELAAEFGVSAFVVKHQLENHRIAMIR